MTIFKLFQDNLWVQPKGCDGDNKNNLQKYKHFVDLFLQADYIKRLAKFYKPFDFKKGKWVDV